MAKTKLTGRKRDERITAYAFTAPAVILLIAFLVVFLMNLIAGKSTNAKRRW